MRKACAVALAIFGAAATAAGADEATRAAYSQGFWDGYAAAQRGLDSGAKSAGPAFGLSSADPAAPVWVVAGGGGQDHRTLALPGVFEAPDGTGAVYFKGPWLWLNADTDDEFDGRTLDLDALYRAEDLTEAPAVPEAVTEQIRKMRQMGINEGLVILSVAN
jgi:hypothetical protein